MFIKRDQDARPGVTNLDAYIHHLTTLLSAKHLSRRLSTENIDHLNKIAKEVTVWLNKEHPSAGILEKSIRDNVCN